MENNLRPVDYKGFVLIPEERGGVLVKAKCEELDFSRGGLITWDEVLVDFKKFVDEIMNNKVPISNSEKELNRLKTLLENEPAVFYGTGQVYDLLTLCDNLVEASKKKEKKTKKVKELVIGDKIILPDVLGVHTVTQLKFTEYGVFQLDNSPGNSIYSSDTEVTVIEERKRVEQLVAGDRVIFPGCKGPSTIIFINEMVDQPNRYEVVTKEYNTAGKYYGDVEVVYLHNEKDNAK